MTEAQISAPPRRRPRWFIPVLTIGAAVAAGVTLAVVLMLGGGRTINGTLHLVDPDAAWTYGQPCTGEGGFADVQAGAVVTVSNKAGTVVATGRLDAGSYRGDINRGFSCDFAFTVSGVPDSDLYTIQVGRRGGLAFTADEVGQPLQLRIGR